MSESIEFTVLHPPIAQPRARAGTRGWKSVVYSPADHPVETFKMMTQLAAGRAMGKRRPFTGPVRVDCTFVFARTKAERKLKSQPRIPHAKKPDRDNLDKAVLDALKGLAWIDDCQVCDGRIEKWIAAGDEKPHVLVRISEVGD